MDSAHEAIVGVDGEGTIISASPPALRLLGYGRLEGLPLTTIIPDRMRARHHNGFQRYTQTGRSRLEGRTVRVPAVCGDGTEKEIDLTIRVFRRPDGTMLCLAGLSPTAAGRPPHDLLRLESELQSRAYQLI